MVFGEKQQCSQCGSLCQDIRCFIDTRTGKIWCEYCIGKEKKQRKSNEWGGMNKRWHQKY